MQHPQKSYVVEDKVQNLLFPVEILATLHMVAVRKCARSARNVAAEVPTTLPTAGLLLIVINQTSSGSRVR